MNSSPASPPSPRERTARIQARGARCWHLLRGLRQGQGAYPELISASRAIHAIRSEAQSADYVHLLHWTDDVLTLLAITQTCLLSQPEKARAIFDFLLERAEDLPAFVAALDDASADNRALKTYTDFRNAAAGRWPEFLPPLSPADIRHLRVSGLRYQPRPEPLEVPKPVDPLVSLNLLAEGLSRLASDLRSASAWAAIQAPLEALAACPAPSGSAWRTTVGKAHDLVRGALAEPSDGLQDCFSSVIACAETLFELSALSTAVHTPAPSDLDPVLLDVFRIDARDTVQNLQRIIATWARQAPGAHDRMTVRIALQGLRREAAAVGLAEFSKDLELLEHLVGVLPLEHLPGQMPKIQHCLNDVIGYTEAVSDAPALEWSGAWAEDIMPLIPEFIQPREAAGNITIEAERLAKFTQVVTTLLREREYLDHRFALLHRHRDHLLKEDASVRETSDIRAWRSEVERLTQEALGPRHSFSEAARRVETELRELTDLPMTSLIPNIRNAALEASAGTGRKVTLVFDVADHPINRVILDRVTHWISELVGNAIQHGIEPPDVRAQVGKPSAGRVTVACHRFPSHALIEVQDDGSGLNPAHIAQVARRYGWIGSDTPSDAVLERLLAMPGFSTLWLDGDAHQRGLSLHSLRRQVESCGGYLGLHWKLGSGFSASLQMPLERPVIDIVRVRVGPWWLGLPLHLVENGILLDECQFDPENSSCEVDGQALPVISLRHLFGLGPVASPPRALVVKASGRKVALEVDAAPGREDLYLRPFPRPLRAHPILNALAEGSDGELIWVLNIPEIIRRTTLKSLESAPVHNEPPPPASPEPAMEPLTSPLPIVVPEQQHVVAEVEPPQPEVAQEGEPTPAPPVEIAPELEPEPETAPSDEPETLDASEAPLPPVALPQKGRLLLASEATGPRSKLVETLSAAGWDVLCVANGQEALNFLAEQTVDVVCADLNMPIMNGFELISELRARPLLQHLPVVALMDSPHPAAEQRALRLGALRSVLKQLSTEQWHAILRQIVSTSRT